ncbi:CRISPR-associated RAMP protein, Csx10 family [Anoxybacillus thermarum]|uniref:CRISPR-associated RAMP protein, Csx10 family n=1 Tax=Anoxybacillus thermarum TaxID=404937 RepID=A0A0D0RYW3_9BACL|nr:RAMP superfamily CRISPR-associated protein [Anoxybacillus thermarum]KIQ94510.1 CRISPR-associated RAMP protein, Csx10 family [Anoxybacillus thermarum]
MEKWNVIIEALQPISIAAMPDREAHWDTTLIIPGSTLRGAIAEEWKNRVGFDHALTHQLFQKGIWRDALSKGTKLVTADLFYSKQTQEKKSVLSDYIRHPLTNFLKHKNDSLLPSEQGFFNDHLVINQAVSISISPTRNAVRHGRLYSLSAIAEGSLFTTRVTLPREALQLLNEKGQGDDISFTCYIGKKRSSGYGKVKIIFQEIKSNKNQMSQDLLKRIEKYNRELGNQEFVNGTWYVALISISPMILLDRFLRYTTEIDWETHICRKIDENKTLQKLFDQKGELVVSWGTSSVRHGWNSAWNTPKQAEWVLNPGTIHLLKFTNLTTEEKEAIIDLLLLLEENGVGERIEEGFGQVVVSGCFGKELNLDESTIEMKFHNNRVFEKATDSRSVSINSQTVEFDNNEVLEKAQQFAEKIRSIIKKSQLYELQQYTAEEIVEQICDQKLDCYIEKRLKRRARNGWKSKIEFDSKNEAVGQHLRNIVNEWKELYGYKKAGEKTKDFLRYIIGYYDIYHYA